MIAVLLVAFVVFLAWAIRRVHRSTVKVDDAVSFDDVKAAPAPDADRICDLIAARSRVQIESAMLRHPSAVIDRVIHRILELADEEAARKLRETK